MRQQSKTQRSKKQEKRYPFSEATRLIEFVDKRHYGRLLKLLQNFRPYLLDGEEPNDFKLKRLNFDMGKLMNKHQFVFDELALFLIDVKEGLTKRQSAFIRYLSTPEHCNLGIKEESLKALILEAKRHNS